MTNYQQAKRRAERRKRLSKPYNMRTEEELRKTHVPLSELSKRDVIAILGGLLSEGRILQEGARSRNVIKVVKSDDGMIWVE
jgi:hypothetical protein